MSAAFSIDVDPQRSLVRIRMSGFFQLSDVERFLEARRHAHASLLCGPNEHLTLNDVSGMKIQSQEVVSAFRTMLAETGYRSRRLAFVTASTLARSQLMRAAADREVRCFDGVESAEAWLFEEPRSEPAPLRRAVG